jgi:hypothetical protein
VLDVVVVAAATLEVGVEVVDGLLGVDEQAAGPRASADEAIAMRRLRRRQ